MKKRRKGYKITKSVPPHIPGDMSKGYSFPKGTCKRENLSQVAWRVWPCHQTIWGIWIIDVMISLNHELLVAMWCIWEILWFSSCSSVEMIENLPHHLDPCHWSDLHDLSTVRTPSYKVLKLGLRVRLGCSLVGLSCIRNLENYLKCVKCII